MPDAGLVPSTYPGRGEVAGLLFTGVPALVIPVTARAPVLAWPPWTLKPMHEHSGLGSAYRPENHCQELCNYLEGVVITDYMDPPYRGNHKGDKIPLRHE